MKRQFPASVVVVGANSQIGDYLLARLQLAGCAVYRLERQSLQTGNAVMINVSTAAVDSDRASVDALVSLAPLPLIEQVLSIAERLCCSRVIAFGSASRFSKEISSSAIEREFSRQQAQAEEVFQQRAEALGIAWTLFRPTMIYGAGRDQTVAQIARVARRVCCFPVLMGATGKRQPVHADDLAAACIQALCVHETFGRAYNLGGAEQLEMREMIRRIFYSVRRRPILLPLPYWVFRVLLVAAKRLPGLGFLRREMIDRMYIDLIVDNADAVADFGYSPRGFLNAG